MNRLLARWRRLRFSAIALVCWLAWAGLAWAQAGGKGPGQPPEEAPPAYVAPYALVIFCIGIGLAVVLTSAKRRDRAKPQVFGEQK